MDPEIARRRKERQKKSKQRIAKLHEVFSSNPEASHYLNNTETNNILSEASPNLANNQEKAGNADFSINSETIEEQNISNESTKKTNMNEEIKETKELIEIDPNKQIKRNIEASEGKETKKNEEVIENKEAEKNEKVIENKEAEKNEEVIENKESNLTIEINSNQDSIKNESSLSSDHYMPKNKKSHSDSHTVPDLIPPDSTKNFSSLFSMRSIPFLIAPIFSYFSIPFGFLLLILMDIILFILFCRFDKKIISNIKNILSYINEFSLRVTCMQCIVILSRIFQSSLSNSSFDEL